MKYRKKYINLSSESENVIFLSNFTTLHLLRYSFTILLLMKVFLQENIRNFPVPEALNYKHIGSHNKYHIMKTNFFMGSTLYMKT